MATPQPVFWGWSQDSLINATTNGYKWSLDADRTVDWAIAGGFAGESWNNPSALLFHASIMLAIFSNYADIRFRYVGSYSNPQLAYAGGSEITLTMSDSWSFFSSSSTWARAFAPWPDASSLIYQGEAGDVYLNVHSPANYLPTYAPGSAGWFVFMHEIGHALGLKHPHDGGGTGRPTLGQVGLDWLNRDWATIMSYQDEYDWAIRQWDPATPMVLDVIALQHLYGPNMSTNAGDSVLKLQRDIYYSTYWDASGQDIVDLSASNEGWIVLLPNFAPSTVVATKVGVAVPLAEVGLPAPHYLAWLAGDYEHVIGSAYADFIQGSDLGNWINAGAGDDIVDGGTGLDTAVFSGYPGLYTLERQSDTSVILRGPDGVDTLTNVERLRIGNHQIAIDIEGAAGQAYRLYKAAFDRQPDIGGLGYQMNDLDMGVSLHQVASNFIASPEFQQTYGAVSDAQFVALLYANVLDRAPDASGLQYHLDRLAHGAVRADILMGFSESPENKANVIGQITQGMVYVW